MSPHYFWRSIAQELGRQTLQEDGWTLHGETWSRDASDDTALAERAVVDPPRPHLKKNT